MQYGDQQAMWTMNRAAYGDTAAAAIMSNGGGYGQPSFAQDPISYVGSQIRPVMYAPPARVNVGYYGMYHQNPTFLQSMGDMFGVRDTPRSMYTYEYLANSSADFGAKLGGGMAGAGLSLAGLGIGNMMGSVIGRLIGGGAMGFAGMMGVSMVGMWLANQVQDAYAQRQGMQNFLEQTSYRYINAGSALADPRFGSGMSRGARREATNFIMGMERNDPFLDMNDMNNILQGASSMGLMNGISSMDQFKSRFKDIADAVKVVTKTLHTTLEQSLKTIQELRSIGIDPSRASTLVQNADAFGKMAGKTATEMMALGFQGADAFRGTGVSMGIGFQSSIMNNAAIRAARDAGLLSQEAIAQAGGEEALAQRMTIGSLATAQSQFGRGYNAAFMKGGQFDPLSFQKSMMNGGGDFVQNAISAAGNIRSPADLLNYQAYQAKNLSKMGEMFGGQGLMNAEKGMIMSYGSYLAKNTGVTTEVGFRNAAQMMGKSEAEIETMLASIKNYRGEYNAKQKADMHVYEKASIEEAQQAFIFNRFGDRISDAWHRGLDVAAKPISRFVDDMQEKSNRWVERTIYGIDRVSDMSAFASSLSGRGARKLNKGNITLDVDAQENGGWVADVLGSTAGVSGGSLGVIGGIAAGFLGGGKIADIIKTSYGESLVKTLSENNGALAKAYGIKMVQTDATSMNGYIMADHGAFGKNTLLERKSVEAAILKAQESLSAFRISDEDFSRRGGSARSLEQLISTGAFRKDANIDELASGMFSRKVNGKDVAVKGFSELTPLEIKQMEIELRSTGYEKMIKDKKTGDTKLVGLDRALSQEGIKQVSKDLEKLKDELSDGGKLGDVALAKIEQSLDDSGTKLKGNGSKAIEAIMKDQKMNEGAARAYLNNFLVKNGGQKIRDLRSLSVAYLEGEREYGSSALVSMATDAAIANNLDYDLARNEAKQVAASETLLEAGKALDSSKVLKGLKVGADISKLASDMKDVNFGNKSSVVSKLKEIGRNDLASAVSSASENTDLQKFLINAVVLKSLSGPIATSSKGIEGTDRTALDNLQVQTQINQQSLAALMALNERLRKE